MTQTRLVLVSHALCPYVQRAAIALAEKGVPFERRTVDLADKPDWFRAISPLGKVPLLIVRGDDASETVLFESAVICEYLEETVPGVKLHPSFPSSSVIQADDAIVSVTESSIADAGISAAGTGRPSRGSAGSSRRPVWMVALRSHVLA